MHRKPTLPAQVLTPEDAQQLAHAATRATTPCGDGHVVWHRWGEGAPVVLLHGGSGSWTHWLRNVATLVAAGHEVLAPDLPGFGDSDPPPEGHDADVMPPLIEAGLSALLGAQPVDLVGFSFGGMVAALLAAQWPQRVRRLVLVGAPALSTEPHPVLDLRVWSHVPAGPAREAVWRHNLAQLMLHRPDAIDPLALDQHRHNLQREHRRMKRRRLSQTDLLRRTLPQVQAPLWGIWGAEDALYRGRRDSVPQALALAPRFQSLTWLPDCGHWAQYEQAPAFNAALLGVLAAPLPA